MENDYMNPLDNSESPNLLANTPKPPYYAVIFTSELIGPSNSYDKMAGRMVELAEQQVGFLGR